jgi:Glycosyltransferase family 87
MHATPIRRTRSWGLIAAAAFAFALKTTIAFTTYGTNDVTTFERDLAKLQRQGAATLYREGITYISADGARYKNQPFIHPPFMLTVLGTWGLLAKLTGLPLGFWLRLTSSMADILSLVRVARLLKGLPHLKHTGLGLLAMALCPVSVVISGFHGNTDPVMIALVLLSVYWLQMRRALWMAGAAMGMALSIKIVPVIFIPAVLMYLPGMRQRWRYLASVAAVFVLASLPYIVRDPILIGKTLMSYSSTPGLWGFSVLSVFFRDNASWGWLFRSYVAGGKILVLAAILCLSVAINLRPNKPPLVLQCGAVVFLFLFLTPGFAMQYLAWLVPWVLALGIWPTLFFYAVSGAFVFVVYNDWCGGFPWYAADALFRPWEVRHAMLGLLCWAAVAVMLVLYLKQMFSRGIECGEDA